MKKAKEITQKQEQSNERSKSRYDLRKKEVKFQVGDAVLIDAEHYGTVILGKKEKFGFSVRAGPFNVVEVINNNRYKLHIPKAPLLFDEINVKYLSKYYPESKVKDKSEPTDDQYEVEKIIKHKKFGKQLKFLVRWKGYTPENDSWILETDFEEGEGDEKIVNQKFSEYVYERWREKDKDFVGNLKILHAKEIECECILPCKNPKDCLMMNEEDEFDDPTLLLSNEEQQIYNKYGGFKHWDEHINTPRRSSNGFRNHKTKTNLRHNLQSMWNRI